MKKFVLLILLGVIFLFPEEIFSGMAGVFIILLIFFLVVEVLFESYTF